MIMELEGKEFEIFIDQFSIAARVKELGKKISDDYQGQEVMLIVILNGGFMFASDLIKEVTIPVKISFIKVSSYQGMQSSGKVREIYGLEEDISGKHVIIVDDIVDTGLTMQHVVGIMEQKNPASIALSSFILKPDAFNYQFDIKYVGFTIPSQFIVGYGLDYNGLGRNLKDIYLLKS
jgi:hypoxanthine phosphoribosyltransferase